MRARRPGTDIAGSASQQLVWRSYVLDLATGAVRRLADGTPDAVRAWGAAR